MCCLNRGGLNQINTPLVLDPFNVSAVGNQGWFLTVVHVKGTSNVLADALSRDRPIATEWELDTNSFQWILSLSVRPHVDLFATRENHKLPMYVSPILDKMAIGMDTLRIDWNSWKTLYFFPPVKMMPQVLHNWSFLRDWSC